MSIKYRTIRLKQQPKAGPELLQKRAYSFNPWMNKFIRDAGISSSTNQMKLIFSMLNKLATCTKKIVILIFNAHILLACQSSPTNDHKIASGPTQRNLPSSESWEFKGYTIKPLAHYQIEARVLGIARYRFFGREVELSPLDFALAWNEMSDYNIFSKIKVSQSGRWYFLSWQNQTPLSSNEMLQKSANTHLIPANQQVQEDLLNISPYSIIELSGYLVSVSAPDGWSWKSSTSRSDSGAGSCELMWVEGIRSIYN